MTTPASSVFVDINVLVYANLTASPLHSHAQVVLQQFRVDGTDLWISRQILREYLAAMTRPGTLTGSIPAASLVGDIQTFSSEYHIAEDNAAVTGALSQLLLNFQSARTCSSGTKGHRAPR